jgi:putative phage-type endonuclease
MPLTPDQLAERTQFVGASEAAAVLGMDYKSPLDVYWSKVEPSPVPAESVYLEIGNALEPVTIRHYAQTLGVVVLPSPGTVRHPKYPVVAATPDGIVVAGGRRRGVEAKAPVTPRSKAQWWDEQGEETVPDAYFVQAQMQCEVCDFDAVDVIALIDGELEVREVVRDRELGATWSEIIAGWWSDHVVRRDPPEPRDREERTEFIRRRFRKSLGFVRAASDEDVRIAVALANAKARAKVLEEKIADLENTLKARVGDADAIFGVCTWKTDAKGRVDWKALAESKKPTAQELEQFTGEPARRFLLKVKAEEQAA